MPSGAAWICSWSVNGPFHFILEFCSPRCREFSRVRTRGDWIEKTNSISWSSFAEIREKAVMRCAIVHYWLLGMRGGEQVVQELCRILPKPDIFTLFYDPDRVSPFLR